MTTIEKITAKLLEAGGVDVPENEKIKKDPLLALEAWLAMPEAGTEFEEVDLMEDAAPFDNRFYRILEELLVQTWKPEASTSSSTEPSTSSPPLMLHSNPFLDLGCDPTEISLYKAMESVRVTRLLRNWMELNVSGNDTMLTDDKTEKSFTLSHFLLKDATMETAAAGSQNRKLYPLVRALYCHVEQLPFFQSQLHFYTQSLMRGDRNAATSGKAVADTQSRLAQYKATQDITARLNQQWDDHVDALELIVGEWYEVGSVEMRRQSRAHLGSIWTHFVSRSGGGGGSGVKMENTTSSAIPMTLRVLHRILQGTTDTLHKSHEHLLNYHLLPLHRPSSIVLWRDQTSLLELYHEPLTQCIAILLQKKPEWTPQVIAALLEPEVWNKGGNTPKLVLLLHEIDTYIGILPGVDQHPNVLGDTWPKLLRIIGSCMASDHSRLAERALTLVKTKNFLALVYGNFEQSLQLLLPFLVKHEPSWNPTVRKMTYTVLKTFMDFDEDLFLKVAESCFPNETLSPLDNEGEGSSYFPSESKKEGTAKLAPNDNGNSPAPNDFSLKSAMGGWKPPVGGGSRVSSAMSPPSNRIPRSQVKAPPVTVTGVAPWSKTSSPSTGPMSRVGRQNPPLGVTGVAPWAMKRKAPSSVKPSSGEPLTEISDESMDSTPDEDIGKPVSSRVLAFMEKIKPAEQEDDVSSWSKTQMAETPTLLPNLKFHDLVFGHDLGTGAFGSVRYARLIDRSKTRSQWPEYAVKVISTEKIKELGYEASVQRELAVLRVLSHPGIARLVSSFRFREGVYLVLEYASGGDLHSLLRKNGSLDHDSTRFVMGEVVAAISSIHELGLVYADLKPENVVITESGHVKLTDFGGCRPVTEEGKEMIKSASKNLLKELRDGDWKSLKNHPKATSSFEMDEDEDDGGGDPTDEFEHEQDFRVEGTTAYLPPEVVMGGYPTPAADSWALGCVIFQCLSGRPPILEADESQTRNRIVSFHVEGGGNGNDDSKLFEDSHSSGILPDARNLILQLLNRHAMERPSMQLVADHEFFTRAGTNVFNLYSRTAPPLDVGGVTPVADAQWTRRQFSSIWAPQPQAYDISLSSAERSSSPGRDIKSPIPEGQEATAFFSKYSQPLDLKHASEGKLPPIQSNPIKEE